MDELLPHYERELALLRRSAHAFATRYPKIAARLGLTDGEIDDPHLGRLIQTLALLAARISVRLEDDYPQFTDALIDTLYPEQLRPIPSCAIAQFDPGPNASQMTAPLTVPRGTELEDRAGTCRFQTTYDVTLAPISIASVRVTPMPAASGGVTLPVNTSVLLSITFASLSDEQAFRDATPERIRLHLNGTPAMVAAITDALMLRAPEAYLEAPRSPRWKALSTFPLTAAGYAEPEALLPAGDHSNASWRRLREYFAFPDKFAFLDLNIALLARALGPCQHFTLHIPIVDTPDTTPARQQLNAFGPDHLRLGCTPIVNLFDQDALPVVLKSDATTYVVMPQVLSLRDVTIRSIDSVRLAMEVSPDSTDGTPLPGFHGLAHGREQQPTSMYWLAHRRESIGTSHTRQQAAMTLVDGEGRAVAPSTGQLLVGLTCTNGDYPRTLPVGHPDGDLCNETENLPGVVSLLRTPSASQRRPAANGMPWRLIAGLSPHVLTLQTAHAGPLKEWLRLLSPDDTRPPPLIDALAGASHKPAMQWMNVPPGPTFVRGLEITLTVDTAMLGGVSLYVASRLLDPFFAHFAPANGYVQCVVRDVHSNIELVRCPPSLGTRPIL